MRIRPSNNMTDLSPPETGNNVPSAAIAAPVLHHSNMINRRHILNNSNKMQKPELNEKQKEK